MDISGAAKASDDPRSPCVVEGFAAADNVSSVSVFPAAQAQGR